MRVSNLVFGCYATKCHHTVSVKFQRQALQNRQATWQLRSSRQAMPCADPALVHQLRSLHTRPARSAAGKDAKPRSTACAGSSVCDECNRYRVRATAVKVVRLRKGCRIGDKSAIAGHTARQAGMPVSRRLSLRISVSLFLGIQFSHLSKLFVYKRRHQLHSY